MLAARSPSPCTQGEGRGEGAFRLRGATKRKNPLPCPLREHQARVAAVDARNAACKGKGTINGQRKAVAAAKSFKGEGWGFRPFLVRIVRCDNAVLRDVTLRDAGSWTTNLFQSRNVIIQNVEIDSHVAAHNDGIDIDSCQ